MQMVRMQWRQANDAWWIAVSVAGAGGPLRVGQPLSICREHGGRFLSAAKRTNTPDDSRPLWWRGRRRAGSSSSHAAVPGAEFLGRRPLTKAAWIVCVLVRLLLDRICTMLRRQIRERLAIHGNAAPPATAAHHQRRSLGRQLHADHLHLMFKILRRPQMRIVTQLHADIVQLVADQSV